MGLEEQTEIGSQDERVGWGQGGRLCLKEERDYEQIVEQTDPVRAFLPPSPSVSLGLPLVPTLRWFKKPHPYLERKMKWDLT